MSNLPQDFSYSEDHEWVNAAKDAVEGKTVRIGITSVAADRLGEVVFAELPEVGDTVTAGESCGEVESTKSVSDLYSPVTGTVRPLTRMCTMTTLSSTTTRSARAGSSRLRLMRPASSWMLPLMHPPTA